MPDSIQSVIFERVPTYFVAYAGTLATGEVFTIPNRHRREGDRDENEQVRVIVQNVRNDPSWELWKECIIEVLDNSNTSSAYIYAPNAWQLETPERLKLSANTFTYSATAIYRVIVFYRKPQ